jgi:serine/threonine protein kinase
MGNCLKPSSSSIKYGEDYEIIDKLGSGSFGTVFIAKKKSDGKTYAIKRFNLSIRHMNPKEIRSYEAELENPKKLVDHPFIIKVIELFHDEDQFANLVTQYVPGGDLGKVMDKRKKR